MAFRLTYSSAPVVSISSSCGVASFFRSRMSLMPSMMRLVDVVPNLAAWSLSFCFSPMGIMKLVIDIVSASLLFFFMENSVPSVFI